MPIPVWYLKFKKKHGREPAPNELSKSQRRSLRECCLRNIERGRETSRHLETWRNSLERLEADPSAWHEVRRELEPLGMADEFMRTMMVEGTRLLRDRARTFLGQMEKDANDVARWERVLREVVGVSVVADEPYRGSPAVG